MNTFINRVKYEREVLKYINNIYKEPQLTGLSSISITNWKSTHSNIDQTIIDILNKISSLIGLLTDRSGNKFDNEHSICNENILFEINNLKNISMT